MNMKELNKEQIEIRSKMLNRLNQIMEGEFFHQIDLMAKACEMNQESMMRNIRGKNKKISKRLIDTFNLDDKMSEEDYKASLKELTDEALKRVPFMNPESELFKFKDEILKSIKWHLEKTKKYYPSIAMVEHARWYEYYLQIKSIENPSPNKLLKTNSKLWDFYSNIYKGHLAISPQKEPRAIEILNLVEKHSRQPRMHESPLIKEFKLKQVS